MFEDFGNKIQKWAVILFFIESLACVVFAFILGMERYGHNIEVNHAVFWPLLIGGPLFSYFWSLLFSAFGQLVNDAHSISRGVYIIKNQLEHGEKR